MAKLINLFLICILVTGCSVTPKPEPAQTATPEPTVEPTSEVVENVTEGYVKLDIDDLEINIDSYIYGNAAVNKFSPANFCKYMEKDIKQENSEYQHYIESKGEIKIVDDKDSSLYDSKEALIKNERMLQAFVESVIETCPETIEIVKNYTE